ncbi:MAG: UDP-N-acetylglucosamine 4,6-dehydratase (inverting) [Candidatus Omnitrophica bacterium CG11_big_fil_rev_8_21_14_0_20_63_9]|nr:MAG: UDP-N-acetylglucosamine 4,6-dehydratase (inverting) [Candidatus Omnitrophica bacterium CG11_big_fil_rev_8_21_14_0_20_63_9]
MTLDGASILVTGGTGSFGKRLLHRVLQASKPERLIVYSRDELKQFQLRQQFPVDRFPNLRMFIGDIRDRERLYRVMDGVDLVVHAAALKQVPTAELNPLEAIKTNILGAANLIDASIDRGVERVVALSTDKAANPVNLYGATKLCADKLFIAANATGLHKTRFSVVRYGNVVGSRGSVIPYFLAQRPTGRITITDERMTRFLMTLEQSTDFVLSCAGRMLGGELFIPKIPSARVADLARVIAPQCEREVIGIRPGEKLHETLVPADEAHLTIEFDDHFVIQPSHSFWNRKDFLDGRKGKPCPDGFSYASDTNPWKLTDEEIAGLVAQVEGDGESSLPTSSEPHFVVGG